MPGPGNGRWKISGGYGKRELPVAAGKNSESYSHIQNGLTAHVHS
jgi:hypothetical protein